MPWVTERGEKQNKIGFKSVDGRSFSLAFWWEDSNYPAITISYNVELCFNHDAMDHIFCFICMDL